MIEFKRGDATMAVLQYCPKCGEIYVGYKKGTWFKTCGKCKANLLDIPEKWNITEEVADIFFEPPDGGIWTKETYRKRKRDFYNYCMPFIKEVIIKSPQFDRWYATHYFTDAMRRENLEKPTGITKAEQMICLNCGSYNIRETTWLEKWVTKEEFHCCNCGRNFSRKYIER